ncbi:hypothetical protein KGA66_28265 [Actinocrinis puniceicyclus]|uniref:Uncharacterized protein n=1 Tax=Actinocrinis puniceicyclus TaxID=977794 RepID=A0A8J7WQW5_9ACTN|nr:hypothetical protein [Actinocrinis puniceicyclus]MBS2966961.1 hypothetical protein [Actinocrinis puniceicyclus]
MSGFFQGDLGVLQQMTKTLQDAGEQMDAALKAMSSSHVRQRGTGGLNRAADASQNAWQYGLGQLRQSIQETNDGVNKAHDPYKQCGGAVGQALDQIDDFIMGQTGQLSAAETTKGVK